MEKKSLYLVVGLVVLLILVAAVFILKQPSVGPFPEVPTGELPAVDAPGGDTTGVITEELEGVDLGDIDAEFQGIDTDLNSL